MQKCILCQNLTDKCCSICRKAFYCTPQHQVQHWHTQHKYQCQGQQINTYKEKKTLKLDHFQIYNSPKTHQRVQHIKQDNQTVAFLVMIQQRLIIRKRILSQLSMINKKHILSVHEFIQNCKNLIKISQQIYQAYNPSYSKYIQLNYSIKINLLTLNLDLSLDQLMLAKAYQLGDMRNQMIEQLLYIAKNLGNFDKNLISPQTYEKVLSNLLLFSRSVNADRCTEYFYAKFIKQIQIAEGVWQQIYAYYNFSLWYASHFYFDKSIKAFQYTLQLLKSHKSTQLEGNLLFRADCYFNIALCHFYKNSLQQAIFSMKQAYKLRARVIGKRCNEVAECLQYLSLWMKDLKQWQDCLVHLEQCYSIRKQNQREGNNQIQRVKDLILEVYSLIYKQKRKDEKSSNGKNVKFYQDLLQKYSNKLPKSKQIKNKQILTEQVFKDDTQLVLFKINITPQMIENLNQYQLSELYSLLQFSDKEIEKAQAAKIVMESTFFNSLNQNLKTKFLQINKY